jgi:hypothetical protein
MAKTKDKVLGILIKELVDLMKKIKNPVNENIKVLQKH